MHQQRKNETHDNQWMIGQIVSFTKLSLQCGQIFFSLKKNVKFCIHESKNWNEHGSILAYFLFNRRRIEQRTCDANLEQGILLEIITILIVTIFIQK